MSKNKTWIQHCYQKAKTQSAVEYDTIPRRWDNFLSLRHFPGKWSQKLEKNNFEEDDASRKKDYLILPEGCRFISFGHCSEESNDVGKEDEADRKVENSGFGGVFLVFSGNLTFGWSMNLVDPDNANLIM